MERNQVIIKSGILWRYSSWLLCYIIDPARSTTMHELQWIQFFFIHILANESPITAKIRRKPTIKVTVNTKKTNELNNTMSENSSDTLLWAILVPTVLVIVLLTSGIVILVIYIKKGKKREGQENLISETLSLEVTS